MCFASSYISPAFSSGMCCLCIAGGFLIPTDTYFPTFMMKKNFWGLQHCSGQSFINKCNCVKQVNLINIEMTIILSESFNQLPRTTLYLLVFFLGGLASTLSLTYRPPTCLVKRGFDTIRWSEVLRVQSSICSDRIYIANNFILV